MDAGEGKTLQDTLEHRKRPPPIERRWSCLATWDLDAAAIAEATRQYDYDISSRGTRRHPTI
jgi:hypothetical protein